MSFPGFFFSKIAPLNPYHKKNPLRFPNVKEFSPSLPIDSKIGQAARAHPSEFM
jgi:hypothetical protein